MVWQRWVLIGLLAASLLLHAVAIERPEAPVFDEVHFATYASAYASDRAFIDIHPPLGKVLFALPLVLDPSMIQDREFISFMRNKYNGTFLFSVPGEGYASFPYVALRLVSVLFGLLLILAVYALLTALTGNETTALLAAFLITLENALLLDTRGIFLNGMYLTLGFFALAAAVGKHSRPIFGGILFGLALSVKLVAIVFLGPFIIAVLARDFLRRELLPSFQRMGHFLAAGAATFALVLLLVNNLLLPLDSRIALYREAFNYPEKSPAEVERMLDRIPTPLKWVITSVLEFDISVSGYTGGALPHPRQSTWYEWPFMREPIPYFIGGGLGSDAAMIALVGNPVVWGGSIIIMILGVIFFRKFSDDRLTRRAFIFLLAGYLTALFPFMLVGRPAFLYHYFPALIFAIGGSSLVIIEYLKRQPVVIRRLLASLLVVAVAGGFVLASPYTYGFML